MMLASIILATSIKVPGRQVIAGRILDDVYQEEWKKFATNVKDRVQGLANFRANPCFWHNNGD